MSKFQQFQIQIVALTNLAPSKIEPLITGLTEFELNTIVRALSFGKFDETLIADKKQYALVNLSEPTKRMYRKQMKTARQVYEQIIALKS